MVRRPLPPVAAVISFIDCINRGDIDGLGLLMTDDHELAVFDEEPLCGKAPNIEAWNGYATAFPDYVIYPRVVAPALLAPAGGHASPPARPGNRLARVTK
jgi:hypothetical protein